MFSLVYAPYWTWKEGQGCEPDPRYCKFPPSPAKNDAWKEFARRVAERYPDLAAIQIWNEPNLSHFWSGGLDPERYTEMLKLAHDAIKRENPSLPVLGGALANYSAEDTADKIADRRFLKRMYAAGAKGHMDGISLHPYPADIDFWATFKALSDLRSVRDEAGDTETKLWATEFGVSTTDRENRNWWFDDADQAATLAELYRAFQEMPDVGGAFVHSLVENPLWPDTDKEHGYGVVNETDLKPKPAYCALALAAGKENPCPDEVRAASSEPRDPAQPARWQAQRLVQRAVDAARTYRARNGGAYAGLTPAALHEIDPLISAQPADPAALPGPDADPSEVGVWVFDTAGENVLICNRSKADRSYCIWGTPDGSWTYGYSENVIYATTSYITAGYVKWW